MLLLRRLGPMRGGHICSALQAQDLAPSSRWRCGASLRLLAEGTWETHAPSLACLSCDPQTRDLQCVQRPRNSGPQFLVRGVLGVTHRKHLAQCLLGESAGVTGTGNGLPVRARPGVQKSGMRQVKLLRSLGRSRAIGRNWGGPRGHERNGSGPHPYWY